MNLEYANPELFAAMAKAQAEIENAAKNATNPHFKSRYADLAEVLNTVRPVFSRHGLAVIQSTAFSPESNTVEVTTTIGHSGGGWLSSTASCVPAKVDAQGIGAATTYLRRYALAAMTGVAQEDDDGNSQMHGNKAAPAGQLVIDGIREELSELGVEFAAFEKFLGCRLHEITMPMIPRITDALKKKRATMPAFDDEDPTRGAK